MSDASEVLLAMFEQIREASPAAATDLDSMFGLQARRLAALAGLCRAARPR